MNSLRQVDEIISKRLPPALRQMCRFGVAGAATTFFYCVVTTFLSSVIELEPASASLYAYLASLILSYFLQSRFTFRDAVDHVPQVARFVATSIGGLAVSYGVVFLATDVLELHYLVGAITVCALIPIINFVIFSRWVFSQPAIARVDRREEVS